MHCHSDSVEGSQKKIHSDKTTKEELMNKRSFYKKCVTHLEHNLVIGQATRRKF